MNHFDLNKESWNGWATINFKSDFYDVEGFLKGQSSLKTIELDLLGNLEGKSVLHLQCHFGQDSLSLARMGAKVTGVDLSNDAIDKAKMLNEKLGLDANFINCNVYDLKNHLDERFDVVFTSYGTITWLPDLDKWADIIQYFLKPEGEFIFAEFHPVIWMFDDDLEKIAYSYFNDGPIKESTTGSYADRDAGIPLEFVCWNHSQAEVIQALLNQQLQLKNLREYDYSPYNIFKGSIETEKGKFQVEKFGNKVPLVYALKAIKSI
ncbi:MAG: class I SAM-dependent methyltransferase [Saprospiraceae bacterium]